MTFDDLLAQVIELLQREGRVSYRALKRRFDLDDDYLEDLKAELIDAEHLAVDEEGKVLVWAGGPAAAAVSVSELGRAPLSYTPTPGREDPDVQGRLGRGTQTGHGVVCRPEGLDGATGRP